MVNKVSMLVLWLWHKKMTGAWFAREIPSLMADAQKLKEMGRRAYKLGIRDAAHVMAEATLKVVK